MFDIKNKLGLAWQYLPIMLVTLFFVAETEMTDRLAGTCCSLIILALLVLMIYTGVVIIGLNKWLVVLVAIVLWGIMIQVRKKIGI